MCDVTQKNFDEVYSKLQTTLKHATIVGIDTEFTGFESDNVPKLSLFDTIEERYAKARKSIDPFVVIQFGITVFQRVQEENKYTAEIFNFYLLPRSIPIKNRQFLWQVAALEFLSSYNFNFNKMGHSGISYLDEIEERELRELLKNDKFYTEAENYISYNEGDTIRDFSKRTADWLKMGGKDILTITASSPSLHYLLQKELRNRFPNIWTLSENLNTTVIKVSEDLRKVLETEEGQNLEYVLLDSYLGFSKVFKLLVEEKKPIVGHNVFLDLLFMHKLFYRPLPETYHEFKTAIHNLFPVIYDTKFLSFNFNKKFDKEVWPLTSLGYVYDYLKEGNGSRLVLNSPLIVTVDHKPIIDGTVHTAGWDSYLTGHIFLKMAYVFAVDKFGKGTEYKVLTNAEVMSSVRDNVNCVNLSRANMLYLKLDGVDPPSQRPQWLFVKALKPKNLDIGQITNKLSQFGDISVRRVKQGHVLVAVSNHKSVSAILQHFHNNKELCVVPYSPIRHSPSVKYLLIGSVCISTGLLAWTFHRSVQKSISSDAL